MEGTVESSVIFRSNENLIESSYFDGEIGFYAVFAGGDSNPR